MNFTGKDFPWTTVPEGAGCPAEGFIFPRY